MKRLLAALTFIIALAAPALADAITVSDVERGAAMRGISAKTTLECVAPNCGQGATLPLPGRLDYAQATPPAVTLPAVQPVAPADLGPVTVVEQKRNIVLGDLAGEVLQWLAAAFGIPIAGYIVVILKRVFDWLGFKMSENLRAKLQDIIVNGLNMSVAKAKDELRGKGVVDIKSEAVASTIAYAQEHAAETMTALGLDPNSGAAVEIIKARIEKAINDQNTPTPPEVTPETGKPATVSVTTGDPAASTPQPAA